MGFDLFRLPPNDVDAPPVGFPAGNTRREPLIRIRNARVMLFLEFVVYGIGRGIPAQPELFDELLPLFIRLQGFECGALLVRTDVGYILVEPLPQGPARRFPPTSPLDVFRSLLLCVVSL